MGYVRTAEEVTRIEDALAGASWTGEWLAVQFRTDPETVARLLPPPLAPAAEPLATATVGRWQSSCLGAWQGAVLNIAAQHDGVPGGYVLVIYMDSEWPVKFGSDLFGEPKKLATSMLLRDGDHVHGTCERFGVRLLDLHADLTQDHGPSSSVRHSYNFKARTAAGGRGLEEDAILTRSTFATETRVQRTGTGTIALGHTPHDPCDELEVVEVVRAIYGEDRAVPRSAPVATVPAADFLPYHYGRQDDWLTLAASAAGLG